MKWSSKMEMWVPGGAWTIHRFSNPEIRDASQLLQWMFNILLDEAVTQLENDCPSPQFHAMLRIRGEEEASSPSSLIVPSRNGLQLLTIPSHKSSARFSGSSPPATSDPTDNGDSSPK
jgi:hypothetical protein